jgi:hypothetical protein
MVGRSQSNATPGTPYGLKKAGKWGIVKEGKVNIVLRSFIGRASRAETLIHLDSLSLTEAPLVPRRFSLHQHR